MWTGIALVALNLRPLASGLGPVLNEVRADLGLSGAVAGFITTLPVICFGLCGAAAPPLAARVGVRRMTLLAMAILTVGLATRAATPSGLVFVLASALAFAGAGIANVLIPALVKLQFPTRIGLVTGIYSTLLQLSTAVAAATSAPIANAFGGWRSSLGLWALVSAAAAVPWLGLLRETTPLRQAGHHVTGRRLVRSRTAWLLAGFFAVQSANGYAQLGWLPTILRDAGVSETTAGFTLSVIPGVGMVVSVTLAAVTARVRSLRPLVLAICGCYVAGYAGLLVAPAAAPWLWAVLLGTGGGVFPVALILIGLRSRTGQGSSALSGFVQGIGYLAAASGPFLVGVLRQLSGGWSLPITTLLASTVGLLLLGVAVTGVRFVEDEIGSATLRSGGSHRPGTRCRG